MCKVLHTARATPRLHRILQSFLYSTLAAMAYKQNLINRIGCDYMVQSQKAMFVALPADSPYYLVIQFLIPGIAMHDEIGTATFLQVQAVADSYGVA